jgi:hypothetical protein
MLTWCNLIVQNTLSGAAMDRDATKAKAKRSGLKRERTVGPNGFFRDELPAQILKREHIDTKNKVIHPRPPSDFFLVGLYLLPIFPSWYEIFRIFSRLRSLSFHTLVHILGAQGCRTALLIALAQVCTKCRRRRKDCKCADKVLEFEYHSGKVISFCLWSLVVFGLFSFLDFYV